MFRIITNLLFGEEDKPTENVRSVEVVDEEWHVVSHGETVSAENQEVALCDQQPNSAVSQQEADSSVIFPEVQVQNKKSSYQGVSAVFSQPKAPAQVAQSTCVQKAKGWAERHSSSRNAIQRQNRIYQGIQQQAFHLHQPVQRNLCH